MRQLKHVEREMTGKDGSKVKCLIIPIKENNLFEGEKGVYLDITAIEIKNKVGDSKETHLLKKSLPKEIYDNLTDAEREAMPILGNAIYWGRREAEPQQSQSLSESVVDQYQDNNAPDDDLPF